MSPRIPLLLLGLLALASLTALLLALPAQAQDRAEVAPSQIIGNRELPKVLYIVPWKKPLPDALNGKPPASVLDEALAPIDREVFRREVSYDKQIHPRTATPPEKSK